MHNFALKSQNFIFLLCSILVRLVKPWVVWCLSDAHSFFFHLLPVQRSHAFICVVLLTEHSLLILLPLPLRYSVICHANELNEACFFFPAVFSSVPLVEWWLGSQIQLEALCHFWHAIISFFPVWVNTAQWISTWFIGLI